MRRIKDTNATEGSWLDSWPGTMQGDIRGQMHIAEAYEMMIAICESEEVEELNL